MSYSNHHLQNTTNTLTKQSWAIVPAAAAAPSPPAVQTWD